MQYGYIEFLINPDKPYLPVGYISSKAPCKNVNGDLYGHLIYLKNSNCVLSILSLDSLSVDPSSTDYLTKVIHEYDPEAEVIVNCTHTHYAPALSEEMGLCKLETEYLNQVGEELRKALSKLEVKEGEIYYDYHHVPFNKVGKSRLSSGNDDNIYAGVFTLFSNNEPFFHGLFYNCHPTISAEDAPYLTSGYPGYVIEKLKLNNPGHFSFYNGSDGDISTRFTRKEKSYDEVIRLGDLLSECFQTLIAKNKPRYLLKPTCRVDLLALHPQIKEHDLSSVDKNKLSPKELREIERGVEFRQLMIENFENLPRQAKIYSVDLGNLKLVFHPFELFSQYNQLIDKDKVLLIGYTGSSLGYLTYPNNTEISYESLIEIPSEKDKQEFLKLLPF